MRQTDRWTETGRQTSRHTDSQTDRHTDRLTGRQTDRQTVQLLATVTNSVLGQLSLHYTTLSMLYTQAHSRKLNKEEAISCPPPSLFCSPSLIITLHNIIYTIYSWRSKNTVQVTVWQMTDIHKLTMKLTLTMSA